MDLPVNDKLVGYNDDGDMFLVESEPPVKEVSTPPKPAKPDSSKSDSAYRKMQSRVDKTVNENTRLQRELAAMKRKLESITKPKPETKSLGSADPGDMDLESLVNDPAKFKSYINDMISSRLGEVEGYISSKLAPFAPLLTQYSMQNELAELAKNHPDFIHYREEMLAESQALGDADISLEELYLLAVEKHPKDLDSQNESSDVEEIEEDSEVDDSVDINNLAAALNTEVSIGGSDSDLGDKVPDKSIRSSFEAAWESAVSAMKG